MKRIVLTGVVAVGALLPLMGCVVAPAPGQPGPPVVAIAPPAVVVGPPVVAIGPGYWRWRHGRRWWYSRGRYWRHRHY